MSETNMRTKTQSATLGLITALAAGVIALSACGQAAGASAQAAGGSSTAAGSATSSVSSSVASATRGSRSFNAAAARSAAQAYQTDMKAVLDQLVSQGKITASQEAAILTPPQRTTSGTFTRTSFTRRSGTATGRGQGGFGGQGFGPQGRLNQLVSQGVITQDQANEINSAFQQYMQTHRPSGAPGTNTTATTTQG